MIIFIIIILLQIVDTVFLVLLKKNGSYVKVKQENVFVPVKPPVTAASEVNTISCDDLVKVLKGAGIDVRTFGDS